MEADHGNASFVAAYSRKKRSASRGGNDGARCGYLARLGARPSLAPSMKAVVGTRIDMEFNRNARPA